MSEQIDHTFKAQRRTISIGDISLEVAMLPDSTYRLSYTQTTEIVDKNRNSMVRFCQSKYLKTLLGEDFQCYSFSPEVLIEGAPRPITPVTFDVACLYWQKCAAQGNPKARALVIGLLKRSLYELADEAFGMRRSSEESSSQLREDLSSEGQARIEAMRQSLDRLAFTQPETSTERELQLKIRLRELDLELERLRNKTDRYCLLPDEAGACTIPGITSKAVLEDVLQILKTNDKEEAIRAIYRMGFGSQSGVWLKIEIKRWLFGMPNNKYHTLIQRLREEVVGDPFEN